MTFLRLLLFLAACSVRPSHVGYCPVYTLLGGKSMPLGLVTLPPELESNLRGQLDTSYTGKYLCWYIAGDRLVAGGRTNSKSFVYGEVFIQQSGGAWEHSGEPAVILAVPEIID
jgi:hypothetical protein